jgi:hypothetical protein
MIADEITEPGPISNPAREPWSGAGKLCCYPARIHYPVYKDVRNVHILRSAERAVESGRAARIGHNFWDSIIPTFVSVRAVWMLKSVSSLAVEVVRTRT